MTEKKENSKLEKNDKDFAELLATKGQPNILPKIFTEEVIDTIPDNYLIHYVFQHLAERTWIEKKDKNAELTRLPIHQQIFYKTYLLEMEVNNGGFNQFYYNLGEQFSRDIPNFLKLIGANKLAELVTKANLIFGIENKQITQKQNGTLDGFSKSYDDNPLNTFDDEFYHINEVENLEQLQIDFIRKNKTEFIDK